ncbi:hypothetical protein AB0901_06910 [Streptomyces roseifaciens]
MLAANAAALCHHGDFDGEGIRFDGEGIRFDGEGIRIAAYVLDKAPARPWHITKAPWDPELTKAMAEHDSRD